MNEEGRLPYDVQLRAPEERKKRVKGFAEAAAESFGSGSSSGSRPPRTFHGRSGHDRSGTDDGGSCHSSLEPRREDSLEVQSPLKNPSSEAVGGKADGSASRRLNMDMLVDERQAARKRKSKAAVQTLDLNFPATGSHRPSYRLAW